MFIHSYGEHCSHWQPETIRQIIGRTHQLHIIDNSRSVLYIQLCTSNIHRVSQNIPITHESRQVGIELLRLSMSRFIPLLIFKIFFALVGRCVLNQALYHIYLHTQDIYEIYIIQLCPTIIAMWFCKHSLDFSREIVSSRSKNKLLSFFPVSSSSSFF